MTPAMAALQPEEIIVNLKEAPSEMEDQNDELNCGPVSPDGLQMQTANDDECEDGESASESEEEEEAEEDEQQDEEVEELDAAALLAFSKSRLEKTPQPSPTAASAAEPTQANGDEDKDEDAIVDNKNLEEDGDGAADASEGSAQQPAINSHRTDFPAEEKKIDVDSAASDAESAKKDQAYFVELAMHKAKEAEFKAKIDEDPAYLLKLSQKKVEEAEAKAKEDEEATGEVIKPVMVPKPTRSENSELWALLNYSKMRLESGSTPQLGKKSGSKNGSVRGDDNMSVSSKLSKSSKRSLGSRKSITRNMSCNRLSIVGGPGDLGSPLGMSPNEGEERTDAPFPNVTDNGNESVDGSVSLDDETKNSANNEDESDNSDEDDEESSDEEEDEDELPDFMKDTDEEYVDPEEVKALYEAAKFKAASILSVSEENLTDVQMLQAIAIAEEAARKGDEKFSTKRSLFKLNEARVEDLKSFLNLAISPKDSQRESVTNREEREAVGWGIGQGRLVKKLGSSWQGFREKCNELDEKKQQEREGKPTGTEMLSAAMLDLKAQIDEYEKIVTQKGKPKK